MNTIELSTRVITISAGETYTVGSDEIYINRALYKKADLTMKIVNWGAAQDPLDVLVGIYDVRGMRNMAADLKPYNEYVINGVVQTDLGDMLALLSPQITT